MGIEVEGRSSCIYLNGKIWRDRRIGCPTLLILKKINNTLSQKKKKQKLLCALARPSRSSHQIFSRDCRPLVYLVLK